MTSKELSEKILLACKKMNWARDWSSGGCYLHLEASEFIESLRGKGDDDPSTEAADTLFVLISMMAHHGIDYDDVLNLVKDRIHAILKD